VNNLRFADDIDLIAESPEKLQELTNEVHNSRNEVHNSSKRFGLEINVQKTNRLTVGKRHEQLRITLDGEELEQVNEFVYYGGLVTKDGQVTKDIKRRIGLASAASGKLDKMWRTINISSKTKIKLYDTLVIPVMMYGSECWCLRKTDEKKILVAEMAWLRRILRISKWEHKRNEVIRQRLGQTESLTDKIGQRRLIWF